jgi:outer membrane protein
MFHVRDTTRGGKERPMRATATATGRFAGLSVAALLAAAVSLLHITGADAETLQQAMGSAYKTNPKLDAERARLRATDEEVPRAQSGWLPTVQGTADFGSQRLTTKPATSGAGNTNPTGYGINVTQQVFSGFRTVNTVREAEAVVRAGRENLRLIESTTLLDAVSAYCDVVRDSAIVRLRERLVTVLTTDLNAAETRRTVREVTKTDVAQARARRAKAVSELDAAKANLKSSRSVYERVVGHSPERLSDPSGRPPSLPKSLEEALRVAERESPNVVSAQYREQAARHAIEKIWGELLPDVRLEANYQHRTDLSASLSEQDSASITGRINVPLYQGGETHARVRQAKHTHVSRIQEIEQARTETKSQATTAWYRLTALRAQIKSDTVQVEANQVALEGVREEEKVGQRTLLDVLNAEQELLSAETQLLITKRDLVVAAFTLLGTIGRLNADNLPVTDEVYDPEAHYTEVRRKWFGISITHADGRMETMLPPGAVAEGSKSLTDADE